MGLPAPAYYGKIRWFWSLWNPRVLPLLFRLKNLAKTQVERRKLDFPTEFIVFSRVFFTVLEHHYLRCLGDELGRFKINAFYRHNMDFRANSSTNSTKSLVFSRVFFAVPKPCILSRFLRPAQNHWKTLAFQSDSEWKSKNVWRFTVFSPWSETINIYDGSEAYMKSQQKHMQFVKTHFIIV